jgi:hypothetical protein
MNEQMRTFSQRSIIDSANVDSAHICARQAAYATGCDGASYTTIFFARACCERDIVASQGGKQRGAAKLQSSRSLARHTGASSFPFPDTASESSVSTTHLAVTLRRRLQDEGRERAQHQAMHASHGAL